jgi:hypothetical protein
MANTSTTHVIEIETGIAEPAFIPLTLGQEVPPISVGKKGMWRIESPRVLDVHAFMYFDGAALFIQSADEGDSASVDGHPVGKAWTELHAPCHIEIGGARLRYRSLREDAPRSRRAPPPERPVEIGLYPQRAPGDGSGETNVLPTPPSAFSGSRQDDQWASYDHAYPAAPTPIEPVAPPPMSAPRSEPLHGPPSRRAPAPRTSRHPPRPEPMDLPPGSGPPHVPVPMASARRQTSGSVPPPMMPPPTPFDPEPQTPAFQIMPPSHHASVQPGPAPGGYTMHHGSPSPLPRPSEAAWVTKYRELSIPKRILIVLAPFCLVASAYLLFFDDPARVAPTPTASAVPSTCPPGFVPYSIPAASGVIPCVPIGTPMPAVSVSAAPPAVTTAPPPALAPPVAATSAPPTIATPPPAPIAVPAHDAGKITDGGAKTLERQAVDAVAVNDFARAAAIYDALHAQNPGNRVYAEAARILRMKADGGL